MDNYFTKGEWRNYKNIISACFEDGNGGTAWLDIIICQLNGAMKNGEDVANAERVIYAVTNIDILKKENKELKLQKSWISTKDLLPPISKTDEWDSTHDTSDKVIVIEGGETRFAKFNHSIKAWSVEGRLGNIKVTHWMPILKTI